MVIPRTQNITLAGRESKIIVTNYPFGSSTLIYSTAEVDEAVSCPVISIDTLLQVMTWATFDRVRHCIRIN